MRLDLTGASIEYAIIAARELNHSSTITNVIFFTPYSSITCKITKKISNRMSFEDAENAARFVILNSEDVKVEDISWVKVIFDDQTTWAKTRKKDGLFIDDYLVRLKGKDNDFAIWSYVIRRALNEKPAQIKTNQTTISEEVKEQTVTTQTKTALYDAEGNKQKTVTVNAVAHSSVNTYNSLLLGQKDPMKGDSFYLQFLIYLYNLGIAYNSEDFCLSIEKVIKEVVNQDFYWVDSGPKGKMIQLSRPFSFDQRTWSGKSMDIRVYLINKFGIRPEPKGNGLFSKVARVYFNIPFFQLGLLDQLPKQLKHVASHAMALLLVGDEIKKHEVYKMAIKESERSPMDFWNLLVLNLSVFLTSESLRSYVTVDINQLYLNEISANFMLYPVLLLHQGSIGYGLLPISFTTEVEERSNYGILSIGESSLPSYASSLFSFTGYSVEFLKYNFKMSPVASLNEEHYIQALEGLVSMFSYFKFGINTGKLDNRVGEVRSFNNPFVSNYSLRPEVLLEKKDFIGENSDIIITDVNGEKPLQETYIEYIAGSPFSSWMTESFIERDVPEVSRVIKYRSR